MPATTTPALPPVDPEADRLIGDLFNRYPEARYRITQLAFVQEHALAEAQNRIQRLEWEVQQARQQAQQAQQQQSSGSGGGFFSGLFGGGSRSAPPPQQGGPAWNQGAAAGYAPGYQQAAAPPPQYAPSYQPGMFQRPGSGFLGSALTTAAGVAGGLVAGNALMNLFSGSHGGRLRRRVRRRQPMAGGPWGSPSGRSGLRGPGHLDGHVRRRPARSRLCRQRYWDTSGTTNRRCRTTAAIPVGTATAAAGRATIRSDLTGGA